MIVGGQPPAGLRWPAVTLDELLDGVSDERPTLTRAIEPWDDLSLIYTSGTTGPSKGVRAAHAAFWNYANCFILPYVDERRPLPQRTPDVPHGGHGDHVLDAARGWLGRPQQEASARVASGTTCGASRRRSRSRSTAWSRSCSTSRSSPTTPTTRSRPSTWARCHATRSSPSGSACAIYTAYGMTEVPVPITSALDPDDERSCGVNAAPDQYELRLVDDHDVEVRTRIRQESSLPDMCTRGRSTRATRACLLRRPKPGGTAGSIPATSSPGRGRQLLLPRPDQGRDPSSRREHLLVRGRDRGDEPSARQGGGRGRRTESGHRGVGR